MKSYFIFFLLLVAFAGMEDNQVAAQEFTVIGGSSLNSVMHKQGDGADIDKTFKSKFGYHGGFLFDQMLKTKRQESLHVEAGLLLDTKGTAQKISDLGIENNYSLYYLDIPVILKYTYRLRSLHKLYAGAGPYAGFGLYGNLDSSQLDQLGQLKSNTHIIRWGSDKSNDDLKRLDYGLTARCGIQYYNGINISASFDYGLPNIASMGNNILIRTRIARLSIGYTFKAGKKRCYRHR